MTRTELNRKKKKYKRGQSCAKLRANFDLLFFRLVFLFHWLDLHGFINAVALVISFVPYDIARRVAKVETNSDFNK